MSEKDTVSLELEDITSDPEGVSRNIYVYPSHEGFTGYHLVLTGQLLNMMIVGANLEEVIGYTKSC